MSNTFTINTNISTLGKSISAQTILTGDGGNFIDTSSGTAQTNKEYILAFPAEGLLGFAAFCTKDCLLEFNNSTTGVPSIALAAGKTFIYDSTQPYDSPFTVDVTRVYATVASAYDLKIYPIYDAAV